MPLEVGLRGSIIILYRTPLYGMQTWPHACAIHG